MQCVCKSVRANKFNYRLMKILLKLLIFLVSIIPFAFCSHSVKEKSLQKTYELDNFDYSVINVAIYQFLIAPPSYLHKFKDFDSLYEISKLKENFPLLLIDSTVSYDDSLGSYCVNKRIIDEHAKVDPSDTIWPLQLNIVNMTRSKIRFEELDYFKFIPISKSKLTSYFNNTIAVVYDNMYKDYPSFRGFIEISKPAYNLDKTKALVYIGFTAGPRSGQGRLFWIKKVGVIWKMYDFTHLWIA